MPNHHFISYSSVDALGFALRLADTLAAGPPPIPIWLDKRKLQAGQDWDEQLVEAIRICDSLLFVITPDSVKANSVCKQEWTRALKYKKPIVPLLLHPEAEMPFRLDPRQYIDFTGPFEPALARLRQFIERLASPEGVLQALKDRLADAERDLPRADPAQQARIRAEIELLNRQIAEQQQVVADPEAAARRVQESIERGLERERQPEKPVGGLARSKFINPPPGIAPTYFQDRHVETGLIGDFLKNDAQRLLTVVGRGGIGKTAMVCRLLKALERGQLPDDGDPLNVDGIVYLSAAGSRRINVPHLYADLGKLLPEEVAGRLETLYKDPQAGTEAKLQALLAEFPQGRTVLLLDNFEDVIDPETRNLHDAELDEALAALLRLPPHAVKVIITTRIAPHNLALLNPQWQARLDLDDGLESPYAENILRQMDVDGKVGLRDAPAEILAEARERTRGYPRALEALFAILSADRDTTLPDLLRDTVRLLPEHVIDALVGEAFSRLDPAAQQVMQVLAIYGRPVTPAAVDFLLQPYRPGVNSAPVLGRLVNMQFVRKEEGRYYLHPADRAYACGRVPMGEESDRYPADSPPFTQFALLHRGAAYFKQARKPRQEWKTLDDLAPQLAEFDLRCAGQEYNLAAEVLLEIDFNYLLLWGYYRLVTELHERLQGQLGDLRLKMDSVGNLGTVYRNIGRYQQAITCYEQALAIAREVGDRPNEGVWLGNLGNCYADLGQTARAIDYYKEALAIAREVGNRLNEGTCLGNLGSGYSELGQTTRAIDYFEQDLAIAREVGDRSGEGITLGNLGTSYSNLGQTTRAIDYYEQALAIAHKVGDRPAEGTWLGNLGIYYSNLGQTTRAIDYHKQALIIAREVEDWPGEGRHLGNLAEILINEGRYAEAIHHAQESVKIGDKISNSELGSYNNGYLALAHLYSGDFHTARAAAETARRYDEPLNNHYILALLGLIALRQGDRAAAQEAFTAAVAQADAMLGHSAQNYNALDSKALALCGLALCEGSQHLPAAMEAYRAAQAINQDAGVVGRVVRLFEALAVVDREGVLVGVREAVRGEGK